MNFSLYTYEPNKEGIIKKFSREESCFEAESWEEAEEKAKKLNLPYEYEVVMDFPDDNKKEVEISDDAMLDIMIANNQHKNIPK